MIALYKVDFREPMHGVRLTGTFQRWVESTTEAMRAEKNYVNYFREEYRDEFAQVTLISVD